MSNLGLLYEQGHGVQQDFEQARRWYEKAAAKGNAGAMNNLGDLYEYGHGVRKDHQEARRWYRKAEAVVSDQETHTTTTNQTSTSQ